MSYQENLSLVLKTLYEEIELTPKGDLLKISLNSSGVKKVGDDKFHKVLVKLEKEEQILKLNALPEKLEEPGMGWITDDFYDKIHTKKLEQRKEIRARLARLDTADEMYYLSSKYLLNICEKAPELFKSSKLQEKRDLIKLVLSNCYLDGKKVRYEAKKPFDMVLSFEKNERWGGIVNEVRTEIKTYSLPIYVPVLK